jgi:hypothetical protein
MKATRAITIVVVGIVISTSAHDNAPTNELQRSLGLEGGQKS